MRAVCIVRALVDSQHKDSRTNVEQGLVRHLGSDALLQVLQPHNHTPACLVSLLTSSSCLRGSSDRPDVAAQHPCPVFLLKIKIYATLYEYVLGIDDFKVF